jgi:hypothetical protein
MKTFLAASIMLSLATASPAFAFSEPYPRPAVTEAFHEAGHAVIAHILNLPVSSRPLVSGRAKAAAVMMP